MPEIEYKVVTITYTWTTYLEQELNKLGKQGWNLVTVKGENTYIFTRIKKVNSNNKSETIL